MGIRVEVVDGTPKAVFEDEDPLRRALLPHFLLTAPYFVQDMLYELAVVERGSVESSGFESEHVCVQFFRDRVVIEAWLPEERDGEEPDRLEISVQEAKLLLLEWGAALERRRLGSGETSTDVSRKGVQAHRSGAFNT